MGALEWNESLRIGVESIDNEHKRLIKIANAIIKISNDSGSKSQLIRALSYLREYTVVHFLNEEHYMESIHFPSLGEHRQEHARLKNVVKDYQATLYHSESLEGIDVLGFIRSWLLEHVLKTDMKIKLFAQESTVLNNDVAEKHSDVSEKQAK
ncbi:MAG: bacteriohemerythrin [Proteobacteria bacterium]|nr:bacteriohemerythrin [Pseudomonadota bacterium]